MSPQSNLCLSTLEENDVEILGQWLFLVSGEDDDEEEELQQGSFPDIWIHFQRAGPSWKLEHWEGSPLRSGVEAEASTATVPTVVLEEMESD